MTNAMNQMLKDARNAMEEMQKQFKKIKQEAARSAMEEIISKNKPMTRRDIANMTGLTMDEVETYMEEYVRHNFFPYNTNDRPLVQELKTLHRTYALVNEDGSIDKSHTATIPYRGYVYSPVPGARIIGENMTGAEMVAGILAKMIS